MFDPRTILFALLPSVAQAGRYAAQIQSAVQHQPSKDGATLFHQALSDADLTVQAAIEVALLSQYPSLSLFSEEQEQSHNHKYFPKNASLEVFLDPIDGTRAYLDQRKDFQIILALHSESEIVGAIALMPCKGVCYLASKGEGVLRLSLEQIDAKEVGEGYVLPKNDGPVLLFNDIELTAKLNKNFKDSSSLLARSGCVDLLAAYSEFPGRYNSTDVLEGKAVATLHSPCQGIDGGAIAFIVQEAGGYVCNFDGGRIGSFRTSEMRVLPEVIAASSKEVAELIVAALKAK